MTPRRTDGQTVNVDLSFGDVVDDLKPSGMVFFTAKKGRLGVAADVQYAGIEAQSKALEPLSSRGTLRSTSFVLSAPANYLVFDDGRTGLRLGGGARLWSVETDLKLSDDLLPGRRVTSEETWVDPIVGANGVVSSATRSLRGGGRTSVDSARFGPFLVPHQERRPKSHRPLCGTLTRPPP